VLACNSMSASISISARGHASTVIEPSGAP
jgi:hypothetical protein